MSLENRIEMPLWDTVRRHYEGGEYSHAVLDAMRALTTSIRAKSGLDGDGAPLVGQAFGGNAPHVRLNALQTASEIDEQRGYEQIIRGLYTGVRNPRVHDGWPDTQRDADAVIQMVDLIIRRIRQSHDHFDIDAYKRRVFDPLFVESLEYAQAVASEIPTSSLGTVFEQVFAERDNGNPAKLQWFFRALLQRMQDADRLNAARPVSDALRNATTDHEFVSILQLLRPGMWPLISVDARARTEARLIESVREGRRDAYAQATTAGHLGTWANALAPRFDRKIDLLRTLITLMYRDWYAQNYVGQYFMYSLPALASSDAEIEDACTAVIYAAFVNEAMVLRAKLLQVLPGYPDNWRQKLRESALEHQAQDPAYFRQLFEESSSETD